MLEPIRIPTILSSEQGGELSSSGGVAIVPVGADNKNCFLDCGFSDCHSPVDFCAGQWTPQRLREHPHWQPCVLDVDGQRRFEVAG